MTKEQLKAKVCAAIDARRDEIMRLSEAIYREPELGFKETKTAAKVAELFESLGIAHQRELAITGVKGRLAGAKAGRTVAVLGEMDAVICAGHPDADPLTGAAHCCGHDAQIATMAAVAMALVDSGAMAELTGDVVLFAVPAEEYVEITYRNKLRQERKLKYLGGKAELIRLGAFDDVDMALQIHLATKPDDGNFVRLGSTSNGFIGKLVEYRGRAAHAAMAPDEGVNALNAAMLGIMGVHAQRETFREQDYVRFHPIITQGGDLVNVVPDDVRMESYVRAANVTALKESNEKINRALRAGAMAVGAEVAIQDLPGYLPLCNNQAMNALFQANAAPLYGKERVALGPHEAGSTDTGDLSHLMPVIHPWVGCVDGALHSADYRVADREAAYINTAKTLAMTVIDLLHGDGAQAEAVLASAQPIFSKEEYLRFLDSFSS